MGMSFVVEQFTHARTRATHVFADDDDDDDDDGGD